MNSKHYERLWSAVRGLKDRYRTFEGALGRQQAHALLTAAASLSDAERRLLSIYYQEQPRDRQTHEEVDVVGSDQLMKAVSSLASVADQLMTAAFIAAESDISADERARALLQRRIDEHRRSIRDLFAAWDKAPRPR